MPIPVKELKNNVPRPKNEDAVKDFLNQKNGKGYCDDCLSDVLKIRPRQTINQLCRHLQDEHKISRIKAECNQCGKLKLINYTE